MDVLSRVHVIDGEMYYSPNSARTFHIPTPDKGDEYLAFSLRNGGLKLDNLTEPRWWAPQSEYIAFIPRPPIFFSGSLLDMLAFIPREMEYTGADQGYRMPPRLTKQWLVIDEMLAKATKELGRRHSLSYWRPHPPYFFQYHKIHRTHQKARKQVLASRDWFAVWLGLLYWMTSKIPEPDIAGIFPPSWFVEVIQLHFPQAVIDGLRAAPLLNRRWVTERVGAVLPYPDGNQPSVTWFLNNGVPVWYRWGKRKTDAHNAQRDFPLLPPPEWQLQEATTWLTRQPAFPRGSQSHYTLPPSSDPIGVMQGPPSFTAALPTSDPLHISQAKTPKEILDEFFRDRDDANLKKIETETPVERQRRESRDRVPPITSARVFVWGWNNQVPGLFGRSEVDYGARESTLRLFRDKGREYDPVVNEWHCFEVCDEHPGPDEGNTDRAMDDDRDEHWSNEITNLEAAFMDEPGSTTLESSISSIPLTESDIDSLFLELLRLHYGFIPPLPMPEHYYGGDQTPAERRAALSITGIVGVSPDSFPMRATIPRMCIDFLQNFLKVPPVEPPPDSWDLHPSNHLFIASSSRFNKIQVLSSASGEYVYMFDFDAGSSQVTWKLAVLSASAALLICRLPASLDSPRAIATYLLEKGIRFRTLRPLVDLANAHQERHPPTLPRIRVATDEFSRTDYEFYKRDACSLLQQRHCRAAILHGGILWRIARDLVSFDDVLEGPTARYPQDREMFSVVDASGTEYVDDKLTEDERNLLCGLYLKFTGHGEQQAKVSWYPLVETWEGGGLHRIHWTAQNEEWYKKCSTSNLKDSSARPYGIKHWRDLIRGHKDVKVARNQLERWSKNKVFFNSSTS